MKAEEILNDIESCYDEKQQVGLIHTYARIQIEKDRERVKSPNKFLYDWIQENSYEGINSFDIEDVCKIISDYNLKNNEIRIQVL